MDSPTGRKPCTSFALLTDFDGPLNPGAIRYEYGTPTHWSGWVSPTVTVEDKNYDVMVSLEMLDALYALPGDKYLVASGANTPNEILAAVASEYGKRPPPTLTPLGDLSDGNLPTRSFEQKLHEVVQFANNNPTTAIAWMEDELRGRWKDVQEVIAPFRDRIVLVPCSNQDGVKPREIELIERFAKSFGIEAASSALVLQFPGQRTEADTIGRAADGATVAL